MTDNTLSNILFGNVDNKGRLESSVLTQEERLALGRVTAVKELTRSIDDKKAREASKNDEVPEKEGNDADDADAVDYEEEAEEADDETVEVDDKKYANKALSKYKGKQNTDPDEDDERHIRGVIQRFVDAGWDRNDPRVKAKVEAEYKVLRARKAAKFGYKFNPIVTPARSFKYSKKDLPNLFEGYKDNIVLKFSDMFAPRRELVPIGRGTKTDKNAERAFVPKPDERAIFSDFVAPKAVPKHRKAVTVEKEPTAAVDGKDGTAAGVVDVSKDAETSDAKKKKEAKPKTLKAADSVVDPSVAEFVHEAYTAQWPLLPVAQKLWEESLDWGEEDEETDKVMILDDDLNDQWKVSPPSDSETEIEEATEDGLEAVQPAIRGSSNNSSQANRISLAVPTPRPATPGPGTPGQVVPESPAGSMNGDLGGGSGPDRDNNASSNDASNSANGNNTSAGAGANNNNNNNNNNSSSFSNYNSNSISNSGGSSLSASNQLRGKSHEALEYSRVTPVNTELLYGNWDKEVVWDDSIIPAVPMATNVLLDLNDTKILFDQGVGAPLPPKIHVLEDPAPGVDAADGSAAAQMDGRTFKKPRQKKAQDKAAKLNNMTKEEIWAKQVALFEAEVNDNNEDMYNLSNDKLSSSTRTQQSDQKTATAHSTPAHKLMDPFFKTHLTKKQLRRWHRPMLTPAPTDQSFVVKELNRYIKRKAKVREKEREKSGGGDIFFMRNRRDMSGKDGDIVLFEYSEEHPLLLPNVGMASKVINYYKKKGNEGRPKFKHGICVVFGKNDTTKHLFLGNLREGTMLQSLSSKLLRVPIYRHRPFSTDFLIIRSKNKFHIRDIPAIFVTGQILPKVEIPPPNSRKTNNFTARRLEVYIWRLFKNQKDKKEKKVKIEDIKAAFPIHSETSIRKKLKACSDFKRGGNDSGWWVLKHGHRLPPEEELRAQVTPEEVCAYESMCESYQRLRDAGYGSGSLEEMESKEDNADDEENSKVADEVKLAPWRTTRNFLDAMANKCQLAISGIGDPTGRGEGFSYIRAPNKPVALRHDNPVPRKKVTDEPGADLRKLPLIKMKEMLQQEFNVKKSDIPEGRWKVVDLVREMSTKAAHAAGGGGHLARFARSTRISFAEHHQRFLDECQAAFDKQNAALGNTDQLESDASSDDDDEDLANSLEGMMDGSQGPTTRAKILKITRTFVDEDGNMVKRTEVVRDLRVIEMYIAQEEENAPLPTDDAQNERGGTTGRGKRKRRTDDDGLGGGRAARGQGGMRGKKKCSACGQIGHVKSNKNKCPEWRDKNGDPHNYNLASPPGGRNDDVSEEETVKVEGNRLSISKAAVDSSNKSRKLVVRLNTKNVTDDDDFQDLECDESDDEDAYSEAPRFKVSRRRTTPLVEISKKLEEATELMKEVQNSEDFHFKVDKRHVPDYFTKIKNPMDLETMRIKARGQHYQSRAQFFEDLTLMIDNCITYNGPHHHLVNVAREMQIIAESFLHGSDVESELGEAERTLNPVADGTGRHHIPYPGDA